MQNNLLQQAVNIGKRLLDQHLKIATAESCTGGQLAYLFTSIPGSSDWFERGFVTYSNLAKHENLNVPNDVLEKFGAVSQETALAMAEGVLQHAPVDISLCTTGIAGPSGGSKEKPVGTVWISYAIRHQTAKAFCYHFDGDRLTVRHKTCLEAFLLLEKVL